MTSPAAVAPLHFSRYQKLVVGMLAFLQFAVILDFMLMSPLGAVIMPALAISPRQFGLVVSVYAFSAALSGLLTAGFADRFDRKKLLLTFYAGFVGGTLWCGLAGSFETLLIARIVTGLFGGVIGSIVLAIATDLFPVQMRGRVMGLIQTAFAASQVMGIPIGLYLSNRWNWHVPFLAMAALGLAGGIVLLLLMKPVTAHLNLPQEQSPWMHFYHTVTEPRYVLAFLTSGLLTTGGYMLMPFSSAYVVGNLGISLHDLPTIYLITGLCTIFCGPLIGKAADAYGKLLIFTLGTALSICMVLVFTHLPPVSLPVLILVNAILFIGIFSRLVPFQAIISTIPEANRRGAFNAVNSTMQQFSGGLSSVIAGHIVSLGANGALGHVGVLGFVIAGASLVTLVLVWTLVRFPVKQAAPQDAPVL
jgi:predicted MFS family arabinose efflux permease